MNLAASPPCNCCTTIRQYIAEHLDPLGLTRPDDDPAATLAIFDRCCESEGETGCGLTVEDVAEYIDAMTADYSDLP